MRIQASNLSKSFRHKQGLFLSFDKCIICNVSLHVEQGECLGLIGESGSGKSTLGRMLIGIEKPDNGQILFEGMDIYQQKNNKWRRNISAVFQDYTSSVNPLFIVRDIISEPLLTHSLFCVNNLTETIISLLEKVGLNADYLFRYPHQLSGGQLQRVCIARAIATNPSFILLDEPVSSLDISVQVQIMDLLLKLKEELNISYVFITHDLTAVTYMCDRVIFFEAGAIVEQIDQIDMLSSVQSTYSKKLLNCIMDFSSNLSEDPYG